MIYKSVVIGDVEFLLELGWTSDEINKYIPILDALSAQDLFKLLNFCNIKMFDSVQSLNYEEAINVLLDPTDVEKTTLLSSIQQLKT